MVMCGSRRGGRRGSVGHLLAALGSAWLLPGCDVPEPPGSTGGVSADGGLCGHGTVVASSADFASTNISLADLDGMPLSDSFLSSGSTPTGLSAALSGDVVLPLVTPPSGRVVLIDRQNAAITWAEASTGTVLGQVSVGTGFASNPHDYLEVDGRKAYVTRYQTNIAPGKEPFDAGGDIVILDLGSRKVVDAIPLPGQAQRPPFPDRMIQAGKRVMVVLQLFKADFTAPADGWLVGVSPENDSVAWTMTVAGLTNCGGLAVSPSGRKMVLTCAGAWKDLPQEQIAHSAVVVYDLTQDPPSEEDRFGIALQLGAPVAPAVDFATETLVVSRVYGDLAAGSRDRAFALDLVSGRVQVLAEASAFALGDVRCASTCGAPCLMADADIGALRRWAAGASGSLDPRESVKVDRLLGLPPRTLGGY